MYVEPQQSGFFYTLKRMTLTDYVFTIGWIAFYYFFTRACLCAIGAWVPGWFAILPFGYLSNHEYVMGQILGAVLSSGVGLLEAESLLDDAWYQWWILFQLLWQHEQIFNGASIVICIWTSYFNLREMENTIRYRDKAIIAQQEWVREDADKYLKHDDHN